MKDKLLQFLEFVRTKVNLQQSQEAMRFIIWYAYLSYAVCSMCSGGASVVQVRRSKLAGVKEFLHEIASSRG